MTTRPDVVAEALARLREEVAAAEAHLAAVTESGSFAAQIAAASSVTQARRVLGETARGRRPDDLARHAGAHDAGARALGEALLALPEVEPGDDAEPDDADPLGSLFR